MKNVLVIGNFNFGSESFNGQTSKTRDYYYNLQDKYGNDCVNYFDTIFMRNKPIKSIINLIKALKKSTDVVLLLGVHAASYLVPFVCKRKKKYKYSIYWSVVGGAILYELKKQNKLIKYMSKCDSVYFETKEMTNHFVNLGMSNIYYAPCFSSRVLSTPYIPKKNEGIIRCCTYARVCKEKGTSEAILAVKKVNENGIKATLDIYGQPYDDYKEEFNSLLKGTKEYINHYDYLKGDGVIDSLGEHDIMLFPTYYPGEGFPIGIVECMNAALAVIASDWHYNKEIVEDGVTGLVYNLNDKDALVNCLQSLIDDRNMLMNMRINSYKESDNFKPQKVLEQLFDKIDMNCGD